MGLETYYSRCFLNVVLQALIHNPLMRNHFLADKHNYLLCENMECVSCEMDKLFASVSFPSEVTVDLTLTKMSRCLHPIHRLLDPLVFLLPPGVLPLGLMDMHSTMLTSVSSHS